MRLEVKLEDANILFIKFVYKDGIILIINVLCVGSKYEIYLLYVFIIKIILIISR